MYLDLPPHLRVPIAKLRTSSHLLRTETGRYNLLADSPCNDNKLVYLHSKFVSVAFELRRNSI